MKHLLCSCILIFVFSCAPSKKQICQEIDASIRRSIEALAEKENKKLTIIDLATTDYEMIGEGRVDSLKKKRYARLISTYGKAYADAQAGVNVRKVQSTLDSANYYMKLDSLTTLQITARSRDPKIYYYSKTFVNMRYDKETTADTLHYTLDKKYKLVSLL